MMEIVLNILYYPALAAGFAVNAFIVYFIVLVGRALWSTRELYTMILAIPVWWFAGYLAYHVALTFGEVL